MNIIENIGKNILILNMVNIREMKIIKGILKKNGFAKNVIKP